MNRRYPPDPIKSKLDSRRRYLLKTYGLSLDDYARLLKGQNGKCAFCGKKTFDLKTGRPLAVDHCHETQRIRGLLCCRCNTHLEWYLQFAGEINDYLLEAAGLLYV